MKPSCSIVVQVWNHRDQAIRIATTCRGCIPKGWVRLACTLNIHPIIPYYITIQIISYTWHIIYVYVVSLYYILYNGQICIYTYIYIYRIYIHIILRWIVNRKASCPNKQPNILPCPTLVALLAPATSSKLIRLHTLYFTSHLEDRASWTHHPSEACWRQLI